MNRQLDRQTGQLGRQTEVRRENYDFRNNQWDNETQSNLKSTNSLYRWRYNMLGSQNSVIDSLAILFVKSIAVTTKRVRWKTWEMLQWITSQQITSLQITSQQITSQQSHHSISHYWKTYLCTIYPMFFNTI